MRGYLLQIDALEGAALRFASHDDPALCHLGGAAWLPVMGRLPRLRYDFFGGEFRGQITRPTAEFSLSLEGFERLSTRRFADCRVRLWHGDIGSAFPAFALLYDGKAVAEPQIAEGMVRIEASPDDAWLDTPLLSVYAGTDGLEGPEELTGNSKPLVLGRTRFVPGVQIDAVDEVYQVSAYGAIQAVQAVYDRVARLTATGDHADLTALLAATLEGGEYATCLAQGLVRLGAPPDGQLSFDVDGDAATAWVRKPGAMIGRIAEIAGGTVNQGNLDALDTARPYNLAVLIVGQTTAREVIQGIADSVGAVAGIGWTGGLFVQPVGFSVPTLRFAGGGGEITPSDAPVADVRVEPVASPFWRLATEAEPTWAVHDRSEIATGYVLRGPYSADRVYRLDDLVFADDGRAFAYINATAGSGNAPPDAQGTSNAHWSIFGGADNTASAQITFTDPAPFVVQANSEGATTSDLTTITRPITPLKGGVAQTSGVTVGTLVGSPGAAITATAGVSSGIVTVTLTLANAGGSVKVPVIFGGVTYDRTIVVNRNVPLPVAGGGGGAGEPFTDSDWVSPTSTTYERVTDAAAQVETSGSGELRFSALASYWAVGREIKAQYSADNSSWTDVSGSETTGSAPILTPGEEEQGYINFGPITVTGLSASTPYYVRLLARRLSGSGAAAWENPYFSVTQP